MLHGGEQRFFFNNFFQPNPPTGFFHFSTGVTEQVVGGGNPTQGNSFASLLLGYGDTDSFYAINHSVANKSKETAFYVQDDWKISSKLTLNLGLRYENMGTYYDKDGTLRNFLLGPGDSYQAKLATGRVDIVDKFYPKDGNNFDPRLGFAWDSVAELDATAALGRKLHGREYIPGQHCWDPA